MKKTNRIKIAFLGILILLLTFPGVSGRRKTHVRIYTVPDFGDFVQYDHSEPMPNGFLDVDVCYKFIWIYDGSLVGYAYQYITGITKVGSGNDFSSLHGYGVYHSTVDGKDGTITYMIGNIWKQNDPLDFTDDEYWGAHLKISCGTGYFEGLKGQGELR